MYYSSSFGKMTGGDGVSGIFMWDGVVLVINIVLILIFLLSLEQVVLTEMKEEDKIVGESLHTLSKGIHDKVICLMGVHSCIIELITINF